MSLTASPDLPFQSGYSDFLELLAAPDARSFDCSDVLVVVAHPDDETLALGGQLPRLEGIRILHVTDGAPINMSDAHGLGFTQRDDYAVARRRELEAAVGMAGVPSGALLSLGVPDQGAAWRMPFLVLRLARIVADHVISTIVTHAYEGGHPDHDAAAFIVHAARHLVLRQRSGMPEIVEFPLYHVRKGQMVLQQFADTPEPTLVETVIALDPVARGRKRRMLQAFETQNATLASFKASVERFRPAPDYDFGALPNGSELLYEGREWGLNGKNWLRLVEETCREFGLPRWL